jgi:hypothetical protein
MSKLAQFLKSTVGSANPANSANSANSDDASGKISNFSNISRGVSADSFLSDAEPQPEESQSAILSPVQEAARREVLAQLEAHPAVQRAFVNRFEHDGTMIVTLAIRGVGTGELLIPAERFSQSSLDDYAALLGLIGAAR